MVKFIIRHEVESDFETISSVIELAFADRPYSDRTEQFIVKALRDANALTLSLVAEVDGKAIGHIAFSPVTISDGSSDWYSLGPISVLPEFQKQGIGKSLIHEGLNLLKDLKAQGCVLVGNLNYYRQFGFRNLQHLISEGVPQEYFLALMFEKNETRGIVLFHAGFAANS